MSDRRLSALLVAINAGVLVGMVAVSVWPSEHPLLALAFVAAAVALAIIAYWVMPRP